MNPPMTREEIKTMLEASQSAQDWNARCRRIKTLFGGMYPPFWYADVVSSGLAGRILAKFGETPEPRVAREDDKS